MRTSPRNLKPLDTRLDAGWVGLRETIEDESCLLGTAAAKKCRLGSSTKATCFSARATTQSLTRRSVAKARSRGRGAAAHNHWLLAKLQDVANRPTSIPAAEAVITWLRERRVLTVRDLKGRLWNLLPA